MVAYACCAGQPKEARKASTNWFDHKPGKANDTEMLFFALLVIAAAPRVDELDAWADNVLSQSHSTAVPTEWVISKKVNVPPIYRRVEAAYKACKPNALLDKIGAILQVAPDAGGKVEGLRAPQLKHHFTSKQKDAQKRWKTPAALKVIATLVKRRGVALRRLIHDDTPLEEWQTPREEIEQLQQQKATAESQLREKTLTLALVTDKHRQAAKRLREKNKAVTDARKDERRKIAGISKAEQKRRKEQAKAVRAKLAAAAQAKAEQRSAEATAELRKRVAIARKRARDVEDSAKLSGKRLRRAQVAEKEACGLRAVFEELKAAAEETEESDDEQESGDVATSRRDARGRFKAEPWQHRVLEWAQLARGVPPSTVNRNITEVLTLFASEAVVPLACERQMRKLRGEVTIAGEMIAALRVALCTRIISFGFDESTKFGLGLLSTNTQIEPHDAPGTSVDIVMRGVTLTAGGTAAAISKDIDEKLFTHARRLLTLWRDEHERMFGEGSWAKADMPSADNIGLHRLSENAVVMSDTCNAARATKRLIAEMAEKAGRERIGSEAWDAMSEEERESKCKAHLGDCHDHLRNIIIKAMAAEATDFLKGKLGESLDEFSSFERMSVDPMDAIRAACKELHPDGEYAKGKGRESEATRKRDHPSDLWLPIFNAVGNSRMDAVFDGAVPLYMDRLIILEFLHPLVNGPASKDNILEKFLWRVLESTEMVGLLRVCTLWQTLLTEPLRWLSGKSTSLDDWSMVDSNKLLDETYDMMVAVAADGSALLSATQDPFASIAKTQPKFAAHRRAQQQQTVKAPDGTIHHAHMRTLEEARSPSSVGGNATTPITVELAQRMANAALVAMRDSKRAIADKLSSQDGANAANAAKSARVHEATKGAHVNNSRVESHFGKADNVMRSYRGSTTENYAGMVQQAYNHDFDQPINVVSDRRKRKADAPEPKPIGGFFWTRALTDELRASLVSAVRKEADPARVEGRTALAEHDADKLARREERLVTALNAAVDYYAYGKELFESWSSAPEHGTSQAITTNGALEKALKDQSEAKQLETLRFQIDMRTIGLGWNQFKTKWSAKNDATIGTVAHLKSLLLNIIAHEIAERRLKRLPTEAAPPQFTAKDIGTLGTANADALAVKSKAIFSAEELARKSDEAIARREAAGISDRVERLQQPEAPAFNQQLVGKRMEVLWKYMLPDGKSQLIWATGRVARVADGLTDKRSQRAKNLLPGGAVLWAWDADPEFGEVAGEKWLVLLPNKWNPPKAIVYGWRYDPRELAPTAAPTRDARRAQATCMDVGA